jgi:hypothetical protein
MPKQDKGETMTVGHSYSLAGCSSAEPASASLDENIITHTTGKETIKRYKVESFVCRIVFGRFLENRENRSFFWRWRMQVLLSVTKIWFRDIFKIIGKDHQCRHIVMSSVSWETASRVHEEKDGGASGNDVVRPDRSGQPR